MKKIVFGVCLGMMSMMSYAQFYVSGSGGYAVAVNKKVLGTENSPLGSFDLEGSYGEGVSTQIRGGYFITNTIAVEVGVGYIYGIDQNISKTYGIPSLPESDIIGRGRAFGASLTGVYNFTDNIYTRAGIITKLGGKTEAVGAINATLPLYNETGTPIAAPAATSIDFTTNFRGEFPLGFVGAIGYKFPITENLQVFSEVEYMNINVTRDRSELADFNALRADGRIVTRTELMNTIAVLTSPASSAPASTKASLTALSYLLRDEFKWGTEGTVQPDAPYSSVGINVGIIFTF